MSAIKNVAIIGAGGQIGGVIASALIEQGLHNVTAITRPDSTSTMPSGLTSIRKADYNSHSSLVGAMQGQDALIITMNVMAPKDSQTRLIDAAIEAGVKWIMPNEYGLDSTGHINIGNDTGLGPGQRAIRAYIEEKGKNTTSWIGLACSFWYEFSLAGTEARYGFDFGKKTLTLFDDGNTKINTTTWPLVGTAVAKVLALPAESKDGGPSLAKFRNASVHISSFHLSQRDMLASVLRVTGTKESDWTITSEPHKERFERGQKMMKEGNFMGFGILLYTRAFYPHDPADFQDNLDNVALGLPEEDLDAATKVAVEMAEKTGGYGTHV